MEVEMKRIHRVIILCLAFVLVFAGCGKKTEDKDETVSQVEMEPEEEKEEKPVVEKKKEEPKDTHEGMARSYLTGEWIDEAVAAQRPFACMMGNTSDALPQYGIGDADVIYEVPVEGAFTRLMVMYQDYAKVGTIESIRSCRLYFAYFAKEFDAIYAHWGQAVYANDFLASMDDLDGEDGSLTSTFGRDSNRKAPHNGYTTGEGVVAGIASKGYEINHSADYTGHYVFNEKDDKQVNLKSGSDAAVVSIGYAVNKPWFVYDSKTKLYNRFQFGGAQVDGTSGDQVAVKNVILQYTPWYNEDDNGYLNFQTVSSGSGKFLTNGKVIDITWSKENENSATHYYNSDGKEIKLNQGKTWVCVVQDTSADKVAVYATEDEFNVTQ